MKTFADIIEELGDLMDRDFTAELNHACRLLINETIYVQLEAETTGEFILATAEISELPPGRFRENILKDALKSNDLLEINRSILAYLGKENKLILFQYIPFHALTAPQLETYLSRLVSRAERWKKAIDGGRTAPDDQLEMPKTIEGRKTSPLGL